MPTFTYAVQLTRDRKDSAYVVSCRDIPEVIAQGNTVADAFREAKGALQPAIACRLDDGLDILAPSNVRRSELMVPTPITTAWKAAL